MVPRPRSYTLIDVKTFDPAGPTHINTNHTDRDSLAAHLAIARNCRETEYGPLPARMRLIVLPISIFGAIGTHGGLARPSLVSLAAVWVA